MAASGSGSIVRQRWRCCARLPVFSRKGTEAHCASPSPTQPLAASPFDQWSFVSDHIVTLALAQAAASHQAAQCTMLLQRAVRLEASARGEAIGRQAVDLPVHDAATVAWRRMGLRMLVVVRAAKMWTVACELANHGRTSQPDTYDSYEDSCEAPVLDLPRCTVSREEVVQRRRLLDSRHTDRMTGGPECAHAEIRAMGDSYTYWFRCLHCPARWPRLRNERCDSGISTST